MFFKKVHDYKNNKTILLVSIFGLDLTIHILE